MPISNAVSIAFNTYLDESVLRVMNSFLAGTSESKLTLRCVKPASFNLGSFLRSTVAFVVIPT